MNTLTEETLKELEEIHSMATQGPWRVGDWIDEERLHLIYSQPKGSLEVLVARTCFAPQSHQNATLISEMQEHLTALISSAREALRLREALEKITNLSWGYDGDCGAVAIADEALGKPGGSSSTSGALDRAHSDVEPSGRDQECAHGVRFGTPCEECHQEVLLRKGLDDHSCNSTGWEKP